MYTFHNNSYENHNYSLASIGTGLKDKIYPTRKAAEAAMNEYAMKTCSVVECVEADKHEKTYVSSDGARFYINRI